MSNDSNYWLDVEVERILDRYPNGEIVVSSGISPSASYHVGHLPEILLAESLAWGLKQAGREARHIHVVDNMDPLRRRYDFLPEEYERYVGWPVCLVPNPYGEGSYADHFFEQFQDIFASLGIAPDEIVRSYEDLYCSGKMVSPIEAVLEKMDEVKAIFAKYGREVAADWTPLRVLQDNKFINAKPEEWDQNAQTLAGVTYADGGVKLNWRLDWPARWQVLGVRVEPFSIQEHGAASGSYDTGVEFSREIFNYEPPLPSARYGNVHLAGDTTKMSSSKGNLITPQQALAIMPPGLLRYFIVRSRPEKARYFDTGRKFIDLWNEYKQAAAAVRSGEEHEFARAYAFASLGEELTEVPFEHLVAVYQAALKDTMQTEQILGRTGYQVDSQALENELAYVHNWLEQYAPDSVKFELQEELPEVDLTENQRQFLSDLADKLEVEENPEAEWVHNTIYELKDEHDLKPAQAFQIIYQVLLGQTSGPKAGWFLATIDRDWLIDRLRLKN